MDSAELGLLKNMLEAAGIRCELRNEQLSQTLPAAPFNIELWVEHDDDFGRAKELCESWFHPKFVSLRGWTCSKCGQQLNGEFDSCWSCGTKREILAQLSSGSDEENPRGFAD